MTKLRFTDCDMWDTDWYMSLSVEMKLFWRYLCDRCDNAGVWSVNVRLAETHTGFKLDLASAAAALAPEVRLLACGKKWVLENFIAFQYPGGLREAVAPHRQVLRLLATHRLVGDAPPDCHPPDEQKKEGLAKGSVGPSMALKTKTRPDQTRHGQGESEGAPPPLPAARMWDRPRFVKRMQRRGLDVGVTNGQDRTEELIGLAEDCGCVSLEEAVACIESLTRRALKANGKEARFRSDLVPFVPGWIEWRNKKDAEEDQKEKESA